MQLGQRLLLGLRPHPVKLLDTQFHGALDAMHHIERARFQFGPEDLGYKRLPERFAQDAVRLLDTTLPARLELLRTAKVLAIESKVLIHKSGGQILRISVYQMEAQITLPVIQ